MKRIYTILLTAGVLILSAMLTVSCEKPDTPNPPVETFVITGVSIPGTISVTPNSDVVITGKGFASGDKIV